MNKITKQLENLYSWTKFYQDRTDKEAIRKCQTEIAQLKQAFNQLKSNKNDYRFDKFLELFKKLNIIKDLDTREEHWTYDKLYETKRIAELLKNKIILS